VASRGGLAQELAALCDPPAQEVALPNPTVVGSGSPESVSTAALQAALDAGGHVLIDNDGGMVPLDATLVVTKETVLDGGGATLSGQGAPDGRTRCQGFARRISDQAPITDQLSVSPGGSVGIGTTETARRVGWVARSSKRTKGRPAADPSRPGGRRGERLERSRRASRGGRVS